MALLYQARLNHFDDGLLKLGLAFQIQFGG